jgi:hypothetical protein
MSAYSTIRMMATPSLKKSSESGNSRTAISNSDGIASATTAKTSSVAFKPAVRRSKNCTPLRKPPANNARPSTNSKFPRMEPTIDAFTSSSKPALMAKIVMINSAELPSVAFSSPPKRGPVYAASSSVASPINPASGIKPMADKMKIKIGSAFAKRVISAAGAAKSSSLKDLRGAITRL